MTDVNEKAAIETGEKIYQALQQGIRKKYADDPVMMKLELEKLEKDRAAQLKKEEEIKRKRQQRIDPQNMAPGIQKGVPTRGAARGGKIKKSYARGSGIRKPKY